MTYFSTLAHYVEQLANHIPEEDFLKATSNTEDLLDDCLSMLSNLNKVSFYCDHEDLNSSDTKKLADTNNSLAELGSTLREISNKRQSI